MSGKLLPTNEKMGWSSHSTRILRNLKWMPSLPKADTFLKGLKLVPSNIWAKVSHFNFFFFFALQEITESWEICLEDDENLKGVFFPGLSGQRYSLLIFLPYSGKWFASNMSRILLLGLSFPIPKTGCIFF